MEKRKVLPLIISALLLLGSLAIAESPVSWHAPTLSLTLLGDPSNRDNGTPILRIGGWVLIGAGALMGTGGILLLVEGFTSTDRNAADFGKMMGTGMLVMGGTAAALGVVFLTIRLDTASP